MIIMSGRLNTLVQTLDGLNSTGIPLIAKSGDRLFAAGFTDDLGIYYFVPEIAKGFGIPLQTALNLFLLAFILLGWFLGCCGFLRIFKNPTARLLSVAGLFLLAYLAFAKISDVYVVMMFAVSAFVPNFLAFSRTGEANWKILGPWFALGGLLLGYCNFIRSQSGTGLVLFLFVWLILNGFISWKNKAVYFFALLVCFRISGLQFETLEKTRDAYLEKAVPQYQPLNISHPFWHSVYIGLGYLPNQYGIEYRDGVAAAKVASIDPKVAYCSPEYEKILKASTLEIVKTNPVFVLKTILMKALKLFGYFLIFANFGILFLFYVRPSWREILPMAAGGFFYSLPGLLVVPMKPYVLGMISMSVVFGCYLISSGLEKILQGRETQKA